MLSGLQLVTCLIGVSGGLIPVRVRYPSLPEGQVEGTNSKYQSGVAWKVPNGAICIVSDSGTFRQVEGRILRFDADHSGRGQVWHQGPFNVANGLALSPAEEALYVVCSFDTSVERIEVAPDDRAGSRTLFARLPRTVPDGLAFDTSGNLYVSCYAPNHPYRVMPDDKVELLMDDWEAHTLSNPTNIAFGSSGFDQLFTANLGRWHLTRIDLGVEGVRVACHPLR